MNHYKCSNVYIAGCMVQLILVATLLSALNSTCMHMHTHPHTHTHAHTHTCIHTHTHTHTVSAVPAPAGGWTLCSELPTPDGVNHRLLWPTKGHGNLLQFCVLPHTWDHLPL